MKNNKLSRRWFLQKSLLLAPVPAVIMQSCKVSKASISAYGTKNAGTVDDLQRLKTLLSDKKPLKWVFTGDSITQGVKHTAGLRCFSEIFSERIRWEMGRARDFIINTGVSGQNSNDVLSDFDWRVKQFSPQVVIIMLGTNDCATTRKVPVDVFESNLIKMVNEVRQMGAIPILQTPNIIKFNESPERSTLPQYVQIVENVASKQHAILVNHWEYWQRNVASGRQNEINTLWLKDRLHPSGYGHIEMARLIFKTLSIFDATAFTCSGKVICP